MADKAVALDPTLACPRGLIEMELTPRGVMFRPSPKWVSSMVRRLLVCAVAIALFGSAGEWAEENGFITIESLLPDGFGVVIVVLITGVFVVKAAWIRLLPITPLVVDPNGRVLYGTKPLLKWGEFASCQIETRNVNDSDYTPQWHYFVLAFNRWGPPVPFPKPWFYEFDDLAVAEWLTRQIEAAVRAAKDKAAEPGAAADGGA